MSKNIEIAIIILSFFSILFAFWSFKMHINLFRATGFSSSFTSHTNSRSSNFLEVILNSGVCPFGKFGAWIILIWSLILIILVSINYNKTNNEKQNLFTYLKYTQLSFLLIIIILSILMNLSLAIRSIPFYIIQIVITILLWQN
jgi:hypothetical protein